MTWLTVSSISKQEKETYSVKEIHFTQRRFQKIAIAGETGSGKTTLLKMIAGLVQPDAGEVHFKGERVVGPYEKLIPGHPKIGYLSQHFELRNNYRVEEELECKNELTGEEASKLYAVCRIEHLLKRKTDQLSGGEKQRIALARLLTTSPELLLLDEPFSNLDAVHKGIIKSVIQDIGEKLNITCTMILHDALDILSWADTVLVMKGGQIIQQGTPEQIYQQPINEYCAGIFGEYNLVDTNNTVFAAINPSINGKQMMIRPEQLMIAETSSNALNGTIQNILFWGSYYTIDVLVGQQSIRVRANSNHVTKGDKVYIALSSDDVWHL